MKPIRPSPGLVSFKRPTHLLVSEASALVKPVALPPGRATLLAKPSPTGSDTTARTIGMEFLLRINATVAGVLRVTRTSGRVATSSFA